MKSFSISERIKCIAIQAAFGMVCITLILLTGCSLSAEINNGTYTDNTADSNHSEKTSVNVVFVEEPTTMGDKEVAELAKYDNYIDEMQKRGMFDREPEKSITDDVYERLNSRFYEICDRKGFSEDAVLLAKDTLDALCQNYRASQKGYIDMPRTEEYINENYLDVLDVLQDIDIIYPESDKAKDYSKRYGATTFFFDNVIYIQLDSYKGLDREFDIECFAHEARHCQQDADLNFMNDYYDNYDNDPSFNFYWPYLYLFTEGGATFSQRFVCPYNTCHSGIWGVCTNDESLEVQYTKDSGIGYLLYLNAIEKLVFLMGYDTYDNISKGNLQFTFFEQKCMQYYGEEKGKEFLTTMSEWLREYDHSWKSDKVFNLSIHLENLFFDLIEMNFQYIKTTQQAERYKTAVYHYLEKSMPRVEDSEHNNVTSEYIRIEELLNALETIEPTNTSNQSAAEKLKSKTGYELTTKDLQQLLLEANTFYVNWFWFFIETDDNDTLVSERYYDDYDLLEREVYYRVLSDKISTVDELIAEARKYFSKDIYDFTIDRRYKMNDGQMYADTYNVGEFPLPIKYQLCITSCSDDECRLTLTAWEQYSDEDEVRTDCEDYCIQKNEEGYWIFAEYFDPFAATFDENGKTVDVFAW